MSRKRLPQSPPAAAAATRGPPSSKSRGTPARGRRRGGRPPRRRAGVGVLSPAMLAELVYLHQPAGTRGRVNQSLGGFARGHSTARVAAGVARKPAPVADFVDSAAPRTQPHIIVDAAESLLRALASRQVGVVCGFLQKTHGHGTPRAAARAFSQPGAQSQGSGDPHPTEADDDERHRNAASAVGASPGRTRRDDPGALRRRALHGGFDRHRRRIGRQRRRQRQLEEIPSAGPSGGDESRCMFTPSKPRHQLLVHDAVAHGDLRITIDPISQHDLGGSIIHGDKDEQSVVARAVAKAPVIEEARRKTPVLAACRRRHRHHDELGALPRVHGVAHSVDLRHVVGREHAGQIHDPSRGPRRKDRCRLERGDDHR